MGHYVALLDILGFKDIIMKNPHDEVVALFNNFRIYVQMGLAQHKTTEDKWGRAVYDIKDSTVNSNIISDSLIFWTNDNSTSALFELINCLHTLTSFCHNLPKIFLRGGITYGDFTYANNGIIKAKDESLIIHPIMLGRALVDVYEIEKKLQIAGCVITDEALNEGKNYDENLFESKWTELEKEGKIVKYNMPQKKGILTAWTVNWVKETTHPDLAELAAGFSSFNKSTDHPDVKEKIENTMEYYKFVKANIYKS